MTLKLTTLLSLALAILSFSATIEASNKEQKRLDEACEEARDVALKPLRQDIYKECLKNEGSSKSVCKSNAKAYNGNRINGAPRFYELPACQKAFDYRNKHSN